MQRIYDGNEGAMITKIEAKSGMTNYAASDGMVINAGIKGFLFGIHKIQDILTQEGCMGIRVYYGFAEMPVAGTPNEPQIIIVGTDEYGNDITANGKILDTGLPCPKYCPELNALDD